MSTVVVFGAAGGGAGVVADIDADVDIGASADDGENDRSGSLSVAPAEGWSPTHGNSLCRSSRSTGMSMYKSREAVKLRTCRSISSLET